MWPRLTGRLLSLKKKKYFSIRFVFFSISFCVSHFSKLRWRFSDLILAVFFPFFSLFFFFVFLVLVLVSICSGQYALNAHWKKNCTLQTQITNIYANSKCNIIFSYKHNKYVSSKRIVRHECIALHCKILTPAAGSPTHILRYITHIFDTDTFNVQCWKLTS